MIKNKNKRKVNFMQNKIAIYGAGIFGHKLLQILKKANIKIDCFVQTEKGEQIEVEGLPILSLDELLSEKGEYIILIAISDKGVRQEVQDVLKDKNFNMSFVYDMCSFINDNSEYINYKYNGSKMCWLCGNSIEKFGVAGENNSIFSEKKIIGGGYRKNAVCPCCGSLDRTRWGYWVLKNYTDVFEKECTVIHFAPEKQIQVKLENSDNCDYYAGDMPYADKMADYIIINHVLEHVTDEKKAVNELIRVLKDDGKIIMSFPISMTQKTFEDDTIVSEEDRDKYYGQKDHVRLYGIDYKERFEQYGLKIKVFSPKDCFTDCEIEKYGLIKEDILMLCSKY